MYLSFFRLKEFPFNLTPDPRFLFMSRSHREAFDHLLFGIHQRHGFVEVVGGIGTGKTTLCRALLEELRGKVSAALIFNTFISELELLRTINEEFEIDASGSTRKQLIDALNRFLIHQLAQGGNACLIIDECQNLRVPVLEHIRMLSNLETDNVKLLQVVMVGQPELHNMLKSSQLRQLDERIHVRSFLEPLDEEDTRAYISHRLTVAGSRGDIHFADGAMRRIYEYSQGNPRRINTICDRCLLIAYSRETFRIGKEHASQAIREIQGALRVNTLRGQRPAGQGWPVVLWCLMAVLGLIGVVGGWLVGQTFLQRSFQPAFILLPSSGSTIEGFSHSSEMGPATDPSAESVPISVSGVVPRFLTGLSALSPPPAGYRLEEGAQFAGMEMTRLRLSWENLQRFQRPCLLEFQSPHTSVPRYGILRGISEGGVWVQEGESGLRLISIEELAGTWVGRAWVFLPPNDPGNKAGARGGWENFASLQTDLARLGYWEGEPTGLHDARTERALMAFQKDMHLHVNGVIDPQTRGMMIQLLGDDGAED